MYFLLIFIRMRRWSRGVVSFLAKAGRVCGKGMEKGQIFLCYTDTTPLPAFPVSEVLTLKQGSWKLSTAYICTAFQRVK